MVVVKDGVSIHVFAIWWCLRTHNASACLLHSGDSISAIFSVTVDSNVLTFASLLA